MMDSLFETRRLRIRPWTDDDAPALFKYASDPDVGIIKREIRLMI